MLKKLAVVVKSHHSLTNDLPSKCLQTSFGWLSKLKHLNLQVDGLEVDEKGGKVLTFLEFDVFGKTIHSVLD